MDDFFYFIFIGLIVGFTILLLMGAVFVGRIVRFFKKLMRGEMTEEEFRRMSNKYYYQQRDKQGPQFDRDYFKASSASSRQQESSQQSTRRTSTSDGTTIIDQREDKHKKIFAQDEGEYVDFVEEDN